MLKFLLMKLALDAALLAIATLVLIPLFFYSEPLFWLMFVIAIGAYAKVLQCMICKRDQTPPHQAITSSEGTMDSAGTTTSPSSLPQFSPQPRCQPVQGRSVDITDR